MGPHPSTATRDDLLEHWQVWTTPVFPQGLSWSAKPAGAVAAVVTGAPDRETLERQVRAYVRDIDRHVREAREKLDALPANWTGERNVQERLIEALAALHRAAQ